MGNGSDDIREQETNKRFGEPVGMTTRGGRTGYAISQDANTNSDIGGPRSSLVCGIDDKRIEHGSPKV